MLLALETSCDETSAAVVHQGRVLSNIVSSQVRLHAEYGGVVPELAAREHLKNLIPVTRTALEQARTSTAELEAVAATQGPGLPGALLVGFRAAQSIAFALRRPFMGVHHHEAHLYSPWIRTAEGVSSQFEPNVSLVVSGGHTMLVHVLSEFQHRLLGSTVDDAAGECFDKVGKMLGLPYPAGPEIDRLATHGNPRSFQFPRPMLNEPHDDFSFSGLKTSVRYFLRDHPGLADNHRGLQDLCASVQNAIVEVLVTKTVRATRRLGVACITASGGVTCNRTLREQLAAECAHHRLKLRLAEREFCTDNAAMIGIFAERQFLRHAALTSVDDEIRPAWELAPTFESVKAG